MNRQSILEGKPFAVPQKSLGFTTPCRILITGPTCCGKSRLISKIVEYRHLLFDKIFDFVGYYYPVNTLTLSRQQQIDRLRAHCPNLYTAEGLPPIDDLVNDDVYTGTAAPKLLIVDDLYASVSGSQAFQNLMEIHSHHSNISVIMTAQNVFQKGSNSTSILRNVSDLIVFDSKLQRHAVSILSAQMFPGEHNWLPRCMHWLREHVQCPVDRYLWIDSHPLSNTPEVLRIRSHIIPDDSGDYQLVFGQ